MTVTSVESGNTYTLDVELNGRSVERIYFSKGGWIDIVDGELEPDLTGECVDENGRTWIVDGSATEALGGSADASEDDGDAVSEAAEE